VLQHDIYAYQGFCGQKLLFLALGDDCRNFSDGEKITSQVLSAGKVIERVRKGLTLAEGTCWPPAGVGAHCGLLLPCSCLSADMPAGTDIICQLDEW